MNFSLTLNRGSQMSHRLKDKTISIADPAYAGLPLTLASSEHPGAISFGVDSGADRRLKR
jgi:hypothetical protein